MPVTYAPMPRYAAWPNEIWPAYPPIMFQADARIAYQSRKNVIRCRLNDRSSTIGMSAMAPATARTIATWPMTSARFERRAFTRAAGGE